MSWIRTPDPKKYMKKIGLAVTSFPLFGQLFEMLQSDWLSLSSNYPRLAPAAVLSVGCASFSSYVTFDTEVSKLMSKKGSIEALYRSLIRFAKSIYDL